MAKKKIILVLAAGLLAGFLGGCGFLLPRGENTTELPWQSFDDAKQNFEKIVPYQTRLEGLRQLGFDPFANPNIVILTYSDILRRFLPGGMEEEKLDRGIRECIAAKEACRAYEFDLRQVKRKRYGNFLADFLNFKRKVEITGWRFYGIIVINDGLVTYTLWGGQPAIHEFEENTNPLGPLQGAGERIITP